mmetsp:Transcript_12537/g.32208  ORF Transcript_12537/g.32208 Transcript_12537/m.32208 type:complete len:173 (-) Transcript_12537:574-1092(-)
MTPMSTTAVPTVHQIQQGDTDVAVILVAFFALGTFLRVILFRRLDLLQAAQHSLDVRELVRWDVAKATAIIETQFPSVTLVAGEEGEDAPTCAVCVMEMEAGGSCRELECAHHFHADCIVAWFTSSQPCKVDCPLCRRTQRRLKQQSLDSLLYTRHGPCSVEVPEDSALGPV